VFLVRTRFWIFATVALLAATGAVFAVVARWHKQGRETDSDTLGYFCAALAGLMCVSAFTTFFVWLGNLIF